MNEFDIEGSNDNINPSDNSIDSTMYSSELIDYSSYFEEFGTSLDKLNDSVFIIYVLLAFIVLINFFRRK